MSRKFDYSNLPEDKFYLWKGAKPPERISHGISEDDIDEKLAKNIAGHQCRWYQRGNELVCDIGDNEHGKRIPTGKMLDGQNGNIPVLRDVSFGA